jgi:hypothetical protein
MQPNITKGFQYQAPNLGSLNSLVGGATKPGQVNAQNMTTTSNWGNIFMPKQPYVPPVSATKPKPAAQPAAQSNPFGQLGNQQNLDTLLKALNYTPSSVDMNLDGNIPSDALNGTPSPTTTSQKAEKLRSQVLDSRFSKEEAELLKSISNLRTGIAGLEGTQAREYADLEKNPMGAFGPSGLSSQLDRLSRDQAIELSARTGQLNAYLDNLEMYQGYRPQMVGTPQIDSVTGEAFAYIQDPMTGELTTQSLGQIMTPEAVDPFSGYMAVNEGQTVLGPDMQPIYKAPKTYAPGTGGTGLGSGGAMDSYSASTAQRAISSVDEALNTIDSAGTGFGGLLSKVPGTKTRDFNALLDTIKANVGFNELSRMRAASPTGGALGQVSERENVLLQSVLGSLDIYQSKETLRQNLKDIKRASQTVLASVKVANGIPLSEEETNAIQASFNKYSSEGGFNEGDFGL